MRDLWPQQHLANILADIIDYRGKAPPKSDCGVQLITARNVRPGHIDLSHKEFIPESEYDSWMNRGLPSAGDILFTTEAPLGNACMYPGNGKFAVGQRIVTLRPKQELMNPHFLCCFLQSEEGQTRISFRSTGSTAKGIKARELEKILVPVPPLEHQRKIAEILHTWDEAIEKLRLLQAAKDRRLDALRSALLFGSLRTEGKRANWRVRRLSEVTFELSERNAGLTLSRDAVMGVTNSRGIVPMRQQTVADDISRYKRLPPRAFAYNPMRINVGSIAMNEGNTDILVSPDYVAFGCKSDGIEPDYLDHLRKTLWWIHHITSGGSGSVRQRQAAYLLRRSRCIAPFAARYRRAAQDCEDSECCQKRPPFDRAND
jgi:type I restriction enzyme S subunit